MYYALYRKWRPKVFSDIVGQNHIVLTLQNQVKNNKLSHAYLFTGFRGTGKTTCAKILAKAANCNNLKDGNPCNECKICKGIDNGYIMDVIEIDAASNNGVENIRDLREEANFTPSVGRYRVYIIDEVHMLSIGAFNALLKIMEDPPSYVMFILATTEVHKVPATILSRCQQFNFNKIDVTDIIGRLMFISKEEGVNLEKSAAKVIARHSDGGLRDALAILDSCISYANDNEVDIDVVSKVLSIADMDDVISIVEYMLKKDKKSVFKLVVDIISKYIDPFRLMGQLITVFRDIMILKTSNEVDLLSIDNIDFVKLQELAKIVTISEILQILDILSYGYDKMSKCEAKQLELEMAIIKAMDIDSDKLNNGNVGMTGKKTDLVDDKINKLEHELLKLKRQVDNFKTSRLDLIKDNSEDIKLPDESLYNESVEITNWDSILDVLSKINPGLNAALKDSKGYLNEKLSIVFIKNENPFFLDLIRSSMQAKQTLKQAIFEVLGKRYRIGPYQTQKKDVKPINDLLVDIEKLARENNIDVEIV